MSWRFLDVDPPFGFAHRGGRGDAPENTEAAFAHAWELGYRYLETDVHRTADGELVAFHDGELERVAGLPGDISDHAWDELCEVTLDGGHRIPRLVDLLDDFPEARFNIDPKADDAVEPLIEIIRSRGAVDRVCIGSFSDARIDRLREALGPDLCTSPGPKGVAKLLLAAVFRPSWRPPHGCVQIPASQFGLSLSTPWLIRRWHRMGLQVHYWTVNDRDEMNRLLDRGADAIITDEVEVLRDVLAERGAEV